MLALCGVVLHFSFLFVSITVCPSEGLLLRKYLCSVVLRVFKKFLFVMETP